MIRLKSLLFEQAGYNWNSCKAWRNSGGTSYWNGENGRPKITTKVNDAGFYLKYEGRGSGYAIAHADNSAGDSLHQAFTVVMCECNPYLMEGGLKPDIQNIRTNCSVNSGIYNLNIWIPFIKMEDGKIYQVSRRGGWGHTGGKSDLPQPGSLPDLEGPVTVITTTGNGKITEYFISFSLKGKSKPPKQKVVAPVDTKPTIGVIKKEKQHLAKDKESPKKLTQVTKTSRTIDTIR
jgi:hypothetical protein